MLTALAWATGVLAISLLYFAMSAIGITESSIRRPLNLISGISGGVLGIVVWISALREAVSRHGEKIRAEIVMLRPPHGRGPQTEK
jgi:hypothetical protein